MNRNDVRVSFGWWEYAVYLAVTIPLLLIGVVLWFFGLFTKLAARLRRG